MNKQILLLYIQKFHLILVVDQNLEDAHLFSTSLLTTLAFFGPLSSSLTIFPN